MTGPVDALLAKAGELGGLTGGMSTRDAEVSPDGRTAIVTVPLDRQEDMVPTTTGETMLSMAQAATTETQSVAIGGAEIGQVAQSGGSSELIGIGVAAIVHLITFGGAIAAGLPLLTAMFGDAPFDDNTNLALGHPVRRYKSFTQAADEAAQSRLYGGIHYPMGNENGKVLGRCVGRTVLQRLRPRLSRAR